MFRTVVTFWALLVAATPCLLAAQTLLDDTRFHLSTRLDGLRFQSPPSVAGEPLHALKPLTELYASRDRLPLWLYDGKITRAAARAIEVLGHAHEHGLEPTDYHHPALIDIAANADSDQPPEALLDLELLLSDGMLRFGAHLLSGKTKAGVFDQEANDFRHEVDLIRTVERAAASDPRRTFMELEPRGSAYLQLKTALLRYQGIVARGGWPRVPDGPLLSEGNHAPTARLEALRARLYASGDLASPVIDSQNLYDTDLALAMRRFQKRHGLTVDGKLGPDTSEALAATATERLSAIELSLERLRWLPRDLGRRHLRVDITASQLTLVENDRSVLDMRVIVGRPDRPTAIFSDTVKYLVFYPYWEVPFNLAVQDELPRIKADPSWIQSRNFEVLRGWDGHQRVVDPNRVDWSSLDKDDFPYRLRQRPGRGNALGRIKFMFPNTYNIYLHDTPSRDLFERNERGLSSGCVRLERPVELAGKLLEGTPLWDRPLIDQVLASGKQTTVGLVHPVPIHLVYFTAWPTEQGGVAFRRDIYQLDPGLLADLAR